MSGHPGPLGLVATSTKAGTVDRRAVTALARLYGIPADPLGPVPVIAGAITAGFGETRAGFPGFTLATAALIRAGGDRRDAALYTPDGGSLLAGAARRLGWQVLPGTSPEAGRGVVLLRAGHTNTAVLEYAVALLAAGVPVMCWCDECGPVPMTSPCTGHSLPRVRAFWHAKAWQSAA